MQKPNLNFLFRSDTRSTSSSGGSLLTQSSPTLSTSNGTLTDSTPFLSAQLPSQPHTTSVPSSISTSTTPGGVTPASISPSPSPPHHPSFLNSRPSEPITATLKRTPSPEELEAALSEGLPNKRRRLHVKPVQSQPRQSSTPFSLWSSGWSDFGFETPPASKEVRQPFQPPRESIQRPIPTPALTATPPHSQPSLPASSSAFLFPREERK